MPANTKTSLGGFMSRAIRMSRACALGDLSDARLVDEVSKEYFHVCAITQFVMAEECSELRITRIGVHIESVEVVQHVEDTERKPHRILMEHFEVAQHPFVKRYIGPQARFV